MNFIIASGIKLNKCVANYEHFMIIEFELYFITIFLSYINFVRLNFRGNKIDEWIG